MRIQHNIAALNSYRNLGVNNSGVSKNLEKLSSGYRINRAGDDAAGLAISEKMRSQITGLNTATKNANDGISLVQTAEGALTEVHSMLNRMVEIATQSSNGVYEDGVDRAALQDEMNALTDEINRIADGTNFNKRNLLDGTYAGPADITTKKSIKAGVAYTQKPTLDFSAGNILVAGGVDGEDNGGIGDVNATFTVDFSKVKVNNLPKTGETTEKSTVSFDVKMGNVTATISAELSATANGTLSGSDLATLVDTKYKAETLSVTVDGTQMDFEATNKTGDKITFTQKTPADTAVFDKATSEISAGATSAVKNNNPNGKPTETILDFGTYNGEDLLKGELHIGDKSAKFVSGTAKTGEISVDTIDSVITGIKKEFTELDAKYDITNVGGKISIKGKTPTTESTPDITFEGYGMNLQIGDTNEDFNKLNVSIRNIHADKLGIDVDQINVRTEEAAGEAIDEINKAINTVSKERGKLGAIQNRLEHTINNLSVNAENMTAAESRIRDVDMAKEMMDYTKNNILVQASQAMLAQANQVPQGVLQLLQ